jgi:arylsulfatase A-like enzyme
VLVAAIVPVIGAEAAKEPGKRGGKGAAKKREAGKRQKQPNVIVVMTDDQEAESIRFMPRLQEEVVSRGTTFANSVVSYAFCCPSRVTYFTGQYAKNHGVLTNEPPYGGYPAFEPTIGNSLPVWLQRAGYRTALVGELVNAYRTDKVPPGWDDFHGSWPGGAYGYVYNENGRLVQYGASRDAIDPSVYQTDVQAHKAAQVIHRWAPRRKPFYLHVATFAPHSEAAEQCNCATNNPRAAPRHEGAFANEPLPKPPNYNEADVSDKPSLTRQMTPMPPFAEEAVTRAYRDRLESLLAVDDLIGRVVEALRSERELKRTVILFTSDNGYLQGHHRWRAGKVVPYEPSIRVPLVIRGPGVPRGATRTQLVANTDLAPTILDLANGKSGRKRDGRSLLPLLKRPNLAWGRPILLEGRFNAFGEYGAGEQRIVFDGVRTDRYMYARYENGEEELYDLHTDPFELRSLHADPAHAGVKAALQRLVARLLPCAGSGCRARPDLKLRLDLARGCRAGVEMEVAGPESGEVISARFAGPGRTIVDDRAPFARRLRPGQVDGDRPLVAFATMLDGRVLRISRDAPAKCGSKR